MYLRLCFLFILVEIEIIRAQNKPSQLPVLHDASLLLEPACLQHSLMKAQRCWTTWAMTHLTHHHALWPGCRERQQTSTNLIMHPQLKMFCAIEKYIQKEIKFINIIISPLKWTCDKTHFWMTLCSEPVKLSIMNKNSKMTTCKLELKAIFNISVSFIYTPICAHVLRM